LSASIASLAGWFGVEAHLGTLFQMGESLREPAIRALICASAVLVWRQVHRQLGGEPLFEEVFEHFAANLAFWAALALCFVADTRLGGVAILAALAVVSIRKGLQSNQESFVVYGTLYTALGFGVVEGQAIDEPLLATGLALFTVLAAIALLWRFHQQIKRART
jgi:hypothetical protein